MFDSNSFTDPMSIAMRQAMESPRVTQPEPEDDSGMIALALVMLLFYLGYNYIPWRVPTIPDNAVITQGTPGSSCEVMGKTDEGVKIVCSDGTVAFIR